MKTCPSCNALNNDTSKFCEVCGTALEVAQTAETTVLSDAPETVVLNEPNENAAPQQAAQPQYQAPPVQPTFAQPMYPINEAMLPVEYQPVSVGAYIGYGLLFSIPVIGFIMLLITAFGSGKSKSLQNYARAILIMYIIGAVIGVLMSIFGIVLMGEMFY